LQDTALLTKLEINIARQRWTIETSLSNMLFITGSLAVLLGFTAFMGYKIGYIGGSAAVALGTIAAAMAARAKRSPCCACVVATTQAVGFVSLLGIGLLSLWLSTQMEEHSFAPNSTLQIDEAWFGNGTVVSCIARSAMHNVSLLPEADQGCGCWCPVFASNSSDVAAVQCMSDLYENVCNGTKERAFWGMAAMLASCVFTFASFVISVALMCSYSSPDHLLPEQYDEYAKLSQDDDAMEDEDGEEYDLADEDDLKGSDQGSPEQLAGLGFNLTRCEPNATNAAAPADMHLDSIEVRISEADANEATAGEEKRIPAGMEGENKALWSRPW